jgi:hypothetical protein
MRVAGMVAIGQDPDCPDLFAAADAIAALLIANNCSVAMTQATKKPVRKR